MDNNKKYLEENGLPRRLTFKEGCVGEQIEGGAFRNLFAISECYGEYAEAVARELVKRYNPAPLFQLHWEFEDGHTEMRSQTCPEEMLHGKPDSTIEKEMRIWTRDVQERHPLPDGTRWLMCNEESEHFVWAVEPVKV